jgi:hypothetical protein
MCYGASGKDMAPWALLNGYQWSSASRSASHQRDAAPWHLGQCLLQQELYAINVWPHAVSSHCATYLPCDSAREQSERETRHGFVDIFRHII